MRNCYDVLANLLWYERVTSQNMIISAAKNMFSIYDGFVKELPKQTRWEACILKKNGHNDFEQNSTPRKYFFLSRASHISIFSDTLISM